MHGTRFHTTAFLLAWAIANATACARSRAPAPPVEVAERAPERAPEEPVGEHTIHGVRKQLAHPVQVTVDGETRAVLRPGELPPGLVKHPNPREGFSEARYYRLDEYLAHIGVPVDRVRAVHLTGHRDHVASVEGAELRKEPDRFVFDFGQATSILPKTHWSTTGLRNGLRIDAIRNVAVYVQKKAPEIDGRLHCYASPEGGCAPAYDAAAAAQAKGTRVYVDGKLAGVAKRRRVVESGALDPRGGYSLAAFLETLGVPRAAPLEVELLAGDDVVGRASADGLSFEIPRHGHGRLAVRVPAASLASSSAEGARSVTVTALQVYRRARPGGRPLVAARGDMDDGASDPGDDL